MDTNAAPVSPCVAICARRSGDTVWPRRHPQTHERPLVHRHPDLDHSMVRSHRDVGDLPDLHAARLHRRAEIEAVHRFVEIGEVGNRIPVQIIVPSTAATATAATIPRLTKSPIFT